MKYCCWKCRHLTPKQPNVFKLKDLVQGIEDVFLQLLALPAVDESSIFWIKDVWQQSVKACIWLGSAGGQC